MASKEDNGQEEFGFFAPQRARKPNEKLNGHERKEEGIERVKRNNEAWMPQALACICFELPPGWRGLPEDWRYLITKKLGPPKDPHAWGALTRDAIAANLIRRTGKRRAMKSPQSNARETDEYERC